MTSKEVTAAAEAWAVSLIPELSGSYDYETSERTEGLPDIAIELVQSRYVEFGVDGRLAQLQQIQQKKLKVWDLELILVVDPEPAQTASDTLKEFSDRLMDDLVSPGADMGGRVDWVNDTPSCTFRPPFVEFDDGTRGRICTLSLSIGETVEVG